MAKTTEKHVDWDIVNALRCIEGIGEVLNPDNGMTDMRSTAVYENLGRGIEILARVAREGVERMYAELDGTYRVVQMQVPGHDHEEGRALQ